MVSRNDLVDVINKVDDIYNAWRTNEDRDLWKQNRQKDWYKQVSPDFFPAVTDLINIIATDEFELAEYELVMSCDVFIDLWLEWVKELNSDRRDVRLDGSGEIWNSWNRVMTLIKARTFPGLEPIDQLIAEKVSSLLICNIYGFLDDTGRPDMEALNKAKVDGVPEGWEKPLEVDYRKKMTAKWESRLESFKDGSRNWDIDRKSPIEAGEDGIDREGWADPGPAPESLGQLLRLPGITTHQISQMTGLSKEEIASFAMDLGIALDGSSANEMLDMEDPLVNKKFSANRERLQDEIDRKKNAEAKKVDNYKELGDDVITRVFAMTDDGVGAGSILRALQDEFPATTYEQVLGWQSRRSSLMSEVVENSVKEVKVTKKRGRPRKKTKAKAKAE